MNNEIPDYFCQLSDFYVRTADFVVFFILYFSTTAIPFTIINLQLRMEFLRVECPCTNFRQAWANKDKKLVFLSLDMNHVLNIKRVHLKHIQQSYLGCP